MKTGGMALETENVMGFGTQAIWSSQEFYTASVLGIEDAGFDFSFDHAPFVDSYDRSNHASSSGFGSVQSLPSELENQRVEMDLFLQLESKRLRRMIHEEQKRQQATLTHACESRIQNLLLQKDHELSTARNRARELQERLHSAVTEAAAWEKKAAEKEAVASDLRDRLAQIKNDDTASFCGSPPPPCGCKSCRRSGSLCVVFFPCRHLCCCRSCAPRLGHCPICQTVKEACVEVCLG